MCGIGKLPRNLFHRRFESLLSDLLAFFLAFSSYSVLSFEQEIIEEPLKINDARNFESLCYLASALRNFIMTNFARAVGFAIIVESNEFTHRKLF